MLEQSAAPINNITTTKFKRLTSLLSVLIVVAIGSGGDFLVVTGKVVEGMTLLGTAVSAAPRRDEELEVRMRELENDMQGQLLEAHKRSFQLENMLATQQEILRLKQQNEILRLKLEEQNQEESEQKEGTSTTEEEGKTVPRSLPGLQSMPFEPQNPELDKSENGEQDVSQ